MDEEKQDRKTKGRKLTRSVVKADRMLELALMLPAAVLVGWLIGVGLDRWLHQHWIYLAGIFVGIGSGFLEIFRLMRGLEGEMDGGNPGGDGVGEKGSEDGRIHKEPK
jgi:F0F1-type ATP synthase assembly protein I